MPTAQATQLTPKGERTREHILDTALGLTYRYFARKEDLVLALYQRTANEQEAYVQSLSPAPIADRFAQAMHAKIAQIAPYRDAFGALFGAALTPNSGVAVLGDQTADIRERVSHVFYVNDPAATE